MKTQLNEIKRMQHLAGIINENYTQLNEGLLLDKITPKPSGDFKNAIIALEKYLTTTGGNFNYEELAYLIIDIKDAGANDGY